jgi:hypothetical protein
VLLQITYSLAKEETGKTGKKQEYRKNRGALPPNCILTPILNK